MNLQELQESKKTKLVKRALKEHYDINLDFDSLPLHKARNMLAKVKGLIKEASGYSSHQNATYLKLMMMEQALTDRLRRGGSRIVVENEEVQKSQVILAVQDMIDNIQKMLETVSKMNVEELNAVVAGIKNEFGADQGNQFAATVSEGLSTLQNSVAEAKEVLSQALGVITGEESGVELDMVDQEEVPAEKPGMEEPAPDMEQPVDVPEPEEADAGMAAAGRERQ